MKQGESDSMHAYITEAKRRLVNVVREPGRMNGAAGSAVPALLLLLIATPVMAGTSAGYGMGGQFSRFDPIVTQYNQTGEEFRIVGHCQSACTLFLGIRNVCVDRSATLLFHAGHDRNRNVTASSTNHMLSAYNAGLRDYLTSNRLMDTLAFHSISGHDMVRKFGYRECPRK